MRVPLFTSFGALIAGAGLAAAQPPAPGALPMTDSAPAAAPAAPTPVPPTGPATPAEPAGPVLPPPTPTNPAPLPVGPPTNAAATGAGSPVAAWQSLPPGWSPGAPVSDLAHWYNVPFRGPDRWVSVDYLMYWIRQAPLPAPIVNSTRVPADLANTIESGGILDSNAYPILGAQRIGFDMVSGVRATAGRWVDCGQDIGFEASVFFLAQQTRNIDLLGGTLNQAQPALAVPFNSVGGLVTGETAAIIAGPFAGVQEIGAVNLRMTSRLWGGDADGLLNFRKGEFWRVDMVGGFKFLSLQEDLTLITKIQTAPGGSTVDDFYMRNHFYGGELGGRSSIHMDRFGFDLTAKVALGNTVRIEQLTGQSIIPTNLGGGVGNGGLFVQTTNAGQRTNNAFSSVPQVDGRISYDWTSHITTSVGYNFLYWSNVMRPGDQIDRNINTAKVPVFGGNANGAGVAAPTRLTVDSAFFASGVSLGLEFNW